MYQLYSQKPFIVTYHGEQRTFFASSQAEANRLIKELEEAESQKLISELKKNLIEEKAEALKYGLDIGKLWREMLDNID